MSYTSLRKLLAPAALFSMVALVGCSHEVESPAVGLTSGGESKKPVNPDLVCSDQLDQSVVITGKGFRPMPQGVLEDGKTKLVLPSVTLTMSQSLDETGGGGGGADAGADSGATTGGSGTSPYVYTKTTNGKAYTLSGDPKDATAKDLSWQSEQQMTMIAAKDLYLEAGIYTLGVTNPDKKHHSEFPDAVAVVPPPILTKVEPPKICIDQADQTMRLFGEYFLKRGPEMPTVTINQNGGPVLKTYDVTIDETTCTEIPGRSPTTLLCSEGTFIVPQADSQELKPGTYTITLTNPGPASCATIKTIDFVIEPPPKVTSVAPAKICAGGSIIVATGEGFQTGATAEARCPSGTANSVSTDVSSDGKQITITFGAGAVPGETCDVVVKNPDGCEDRPLPHQTVVGTEGPILFYVSPPVAYSGINTQVKLYVTSVTVSGSAKPKVVITKQADPNDPASTAGPDIVLGNVDFVGGKTNRLQALVPANTPVGTYTARVEDESGCFASMSDALIITDQTAITVSSIDPKFGKASTPTAVTISGPGAGAFTPTPLVFLSPTGSTTSPAVQLSGVTVSPDGSSMTAVVPSGITAGVYTVVVVDPTTKTVGLLDSGYTATTDAPPVVDDVLPQSIIDTSGQAISIKGKDFRGSTVGIACQGADGTSKNAAGITNTTETCDATGCTIGATVDATGLVPGDACIITVTNSDGSSGLYSAIGITNSSFNLTAGPPGTMMNQGRRALVSAAVKATRAARFVYAIGGDGGSGSAGSPFNSLEFAPVTVFGQMQAWVNNRTMLTTARSFAGIANIGRYVYVLGGSDGSASLGTAERAVVLTPEEATVVTDLDLCLSGATPPCYGATASDAGKGLTSGLYSYRVAAVIGAGDPQNPPGEMLASDPITMQLRDYNTRSIIPKLTWTAPVDSQGVVLTGISGYKIYRTPKDGAAGATEMLLDQVDASTLTYTDYGDKQLGTTGPLPQGSTSEWENLGALTVPREGVGGAAAQDPTDPTKWYVYALLGRDGTTGQATYDFLPVSTLTNGHQTVAASWTQGTEVSAAGRWQHGVWTVDSTRSTFLSPGETWIYLGAGRLPNNTGDTDVVEAGQVQTGGQLGAFTDDPTAADVVKDFSSVRVGYGTAAAADRLFVFGGGVSPIQQNATAAALINPAPGLANNSWNNEGLSMNQPRYLLGSSVQSAFIFLVGGQVDTAGAVTNTTELIVW